MFSLNGTTLNKESIDNNNNNNNNNNNATNFLVPKIKGQHRQYSAVQ